jgi:protoporphyrinogen oxidase
VVGAGIAGLTVAYGLRQAGWHVSLIEQAAEIGGLARSVTLGHGRLERYYHFICRGDRSLLQLIEELGLGGRLRWAPAPAAHWYRGRLYPLATAWDLLRFSALPLLSRLRLGWHAWRAQRTTHWQPLDAVTAKAWLLRSVGERAYEVIWRPLLEAKFGSYAGEVAAAWLWHRLWRVGTSRLSPWRPEVMGHLKGGSEVLLLALLDRLQRAGVEVHLGCPATGLVFHAGRAAVDTPRGELSGEALVLCIPLPVVARLAAPALPAWSQALATIPYLAVVCGLLRLRRHLSPYFWVNVHDDRMGFNGFIEYSNLNRSAEVWGGEVVYVPVYLPADDPRFAWADQQWAQFFTRGLAVVDAELPELVTACIISRDAHAQPVCTTGFARRVPGLQAPAPAVYLVEAAQLYPADRHLSGMIALARDAAQRIASAAPRP